MPVLYYKYERLIEALGRKYSIEDIAKLMEALKIETTIHGNSTIEAEIEVDRPDLYISEGIARAIKGYLEEETGVPRYHTVNSGFTVIADYVASRPYIAAAVIWDVEIDSNYLEELIQMQEKLHASLGLGRRRFAIGLHDLNKLSSKILYYKLEDIEKVLFKPLGYGYRMSLKEALEKTEQGRKYGSFSLRNSKHPVLYSGDSVISVPPVINAEETRIDTNTKHIFIDVTGTNKRAVEDTIAVIAANLAERSKTRKIGLVRIEYRRSGNTYLLPKTDNTVLGLRYEDAEKLLGVKIDKTTMRKSILRARLGILNEAKNVINVIVPFYRIDILHWSDIVEDVMLMIGIDKIKPRKPKKMMRGSLLAYRIWERKAREILMGFGFQEIYTFTLTSCKEQTELGGIPQEKLVKLSNPSHIYMDCLRASLIPILLRIASKNQALIPLRIFEAGETIEASSEAETKTSRKLKLAMLVMDRKIGYEDIQAYLYALVELLGDRIEHIERIESPAMISGRTATIHTRQGLKIIVGEIKPELLEKLGIEYPIAVAEIDYTLVKTPEP